MFDPIPRFNRKRLGGLTPSEAAESRKDLGANTLTKRQKKGFLSQYLASFGDPIIKILLAALALNVIFLFRDANWMEAGGIAIAVFLATFVSTLSEYGSESAFQKLMEESDCIQCRCLRGDQAVCLPLTEVVCGDLVLLQAGEKIPADGVMLRGELMVDQSALNGESREVRKTPGHTEVKAPGPQDWNLLSAHQVFRGSVVDAGDGIMGVLSVGDSTFYGRMAGEMQSETRESPLKIRLTSLAETLSRLGYFAAALIALSDLFKAVVLDNNMQWSLIASELPNAYAMTEHVLHALTLAITIVVVAVPEGLPMMITVVLSANMLRMLSDHVMVRKLVGIETSGSLNILFTDKTGTLTRGQLSVSRFIAGNGQIFDRPQDLRGCAPLFEMAALSGFYNSACTVSDGKPLGGNATDRALQSFVLPLYGEEKGWELTASIPFDSARKYSAAQIDSGSHTLTLVKGAPEKLLPACEFYCDEKGQRKPLTQKTALENKWRDMTEDAIRVLVVAMAYDPIPPGAAAGSGLNFKSGPFSQLVLIGLLGIRDELRPEAPSAIRQIQSAGIQTVMITGDNRETACAIARNAGLLIGKEEGQVLTSSQLSQLTDEEVQERLPHLRVVARALPTDKSRLVRLAQKQNLVTGMTGDGINDSPALKHADVGFAMGDGTEVAKEAGDIVIMDNNIASIAKAVLYGRTIFKSIRKFIVFQLTMNFCAVGVSLICPFLGMETPITIIQMLWVNIIMDTLAGLAFAGEPPLTDYMKESPKLRDEPVLSKAMIFQILCMGTYTVALCIFFLESPWVKGFFHFQSGTMSFMTAFFALFIFSGIANSFNARTHRLNLTAHLKKNPAFLGIMTLVAAVQLFLVYHGGALFRTVGLSPKELIFTLLLSATVIPADLLRKGFLRLIGRQGAL